MCYTAEVVPWYGLPLISRSCSESLQHLLNPPVCSASIFPSMEIDLLVLQQEPIFGSPQTITKSRQITNDWQWIPPPQKYISAPSKTFLPLAQTLQSSWWYIARELLTLVLLAKQMKRLSVFNSLDQIKDLPLIPEQINKDFENQFDYASQIFKYQSGASVYHGVSSASHVSRVKSLPFCNWQQRICVTKWSNGSCLPQT